MSGSITGTSGTEITEWNIDFTVDAIDSTSMASNGWVENTPCLKGASGNFKCIGTKPTEGLHNGCTFVDSAVGGVTVSGSIIIQEIDDATPVSGIITYDAKFVFTGTVTAAVYA